MNNDLNNLKDLDLKKELARREEEYNKIKGIDNTKKEPKKMQRTKKVFPKTPSMLPNRYDLGVGREFPLVKDDKGDIEMPSGARYSRKRQHYPIGE